MNNYVVTFASHFDAICLFRSLKEQGVEAQLAPVPRKVSASCGTCLIYRHSEALDLRAHQLEAVFVEDKDASFLRVYTQE